MTFVADQSLMETRDVALGASLHVISGGSDGSKEFEIRFPDNIIRFSAELDANVWRVRLSKIEERAIISNALLAFGYGHGLWADKISDVLFLEERRRLFKISYRWVNAQSH
ncbi:hypothetical protein [Novosphingobium sp. AAP93]|uniref:hypothetical protein n=1 Tax=Novosphingobium sp. AAP93 TaxID=1523427 RepID=UPI0012E321E1|nr:hypothetical protein [Novosphingobium sp. AAP93]